MEREGPISREESTRRTRDAILEAAAVVFARSGFGGASVAAIAEEAGRTTGALFAHFKTKEELFVELLRERGRSKVVAHDLLPSGDGELDAVLGERFGSVTEGTDEWELLATEFWLYAARNDHVRPVLAAQHADLRSGIARVIERRLAEHDRVATLPIDQLAAMVIALGDGLGQARRMDHEAVPADLFGSGVLALAAAFSEPIARPE